MTPAEIAARNSVFLTASHDQLKPLPGVGESVLAQMVDLHQRPTPERCERLAMELEGIRRYLFRIREAMQREAAGGSAIG